MLSIDAQYCVDGEIKARDSWLTMLVGVLILRDGLDEAVGWIDMPVPLPFLGLVPGRYVEMAILLAKVPLDGPTGWLILRLRPLGLWLGTGLVLMDLGSAVLSWNLWDRLAPVYVDLAGAGHSAAARDFAIKFLQSIMPEALLVWSLLMISALVMNRRKFASVGG